jgi:hypothetical protein
MRRPVAIAAVIVIVLLALGAPFLRISWGGTDARVLPTSRAGAGRVHGQHRRDPRRYRRRGHRRLSGRRGTRTVCMALLLNDNFLQELAQIIKSMDLLL